MFRLTFDQQTSGPLRLNCDQYTLLVSNHLPLDHETYREHATLVEHKESNDTWQQGDFLYLAVCRDSAELELAVWDMRGKKRWTIFVEPPWNYSLDENTIHVEVMGAKASFPLHEGPSTAFCWW